MYSSIANNSFSFLLTLDEFRREFPENIKPSWVKVTTITMVSNFVQNIDIQKLRSTFERIGVLNLKRPGTNNTGFEWKLRTVDTQKKGGQKVEFYNQVTLTYDDKYSRKSVKVFPNGSIQVAGCCDLFDCKRIIAQLTHIFKTLLGMENQIPVDSFRVVMINSNFSLNYNINLIKTAQHFEKHPELFKEVSFEPDRYPGVKIKFKPAADMKQITASIFSTGKIIITGAETLKEIAYGYNIVNHYINEEPSIRVSPTEEKDVFNTFLGYKCEDMIKHLREHGFSSWLKTIKNLKINF